MHDLSTDWLSLRSCLCASRTVGEDYTAAASTIAARLKLRATCSFAKKISCEFWKSDMEDFSPLEDEDGTRKEGMKIALGISDELVQY